MICGYGLISHAQQRKKLKKKEGKLPLKLQGNLPVAVTVRHNINPQACLRELFVALLKLGKLARSRRGRDRSMEVAPR